MAINTLFPRAPLRDELNIDSKPLWDTITTLHESREYRLRQTAQRIRKCFESKELNIARWIAEKYILADALTKRNTVPARRLNEVCGHGFIGMSWQAGREVDEETW